MSSVAVANRPVQRKRKLPTSANDLPLSNIRTLAIQTCSVCQGEFLNLQQHTSRHGLKENGGLE